MDNKPLPPAIQNMLADMDARARHLASLTPKPSPMASVWGKAAMQLMQRGAAKRRFKEAKK